MEKQKIFLISTSIIFLFLIFYLLSPASTALAQSLGLGLYPPLLEVTIMPGKSITQVYKLTNSGDIDLVMTSSLVAFVPSGETGGIELLTSASPPRCSEEKPGSPRRCSPENLKPLSFSFLNADLRLGQSFSLPAGKTQEIVLKIKVPETAREKDYYATLLFQTAPMARFGGQSTSQTQTKIGGNVLITVSRTGKPVKKAEIVKFQPQNCLFSFNYRQRSSKIAEANKKENLGWCLIDSFNQPRFLLQIKNTGHSFFKPLGKITLTGWFGQEETLDLLPQNILSDSTRAIQCQADDRVAPCQTKAKFLIGPLRAKLEFGLDDFSGQYQQEIRLIALPIKLILGLLALIILLWLTKTKLRLDKV